MLLGERTELAELAANSRSGVREHGAVRGNAGLQPSDSTPGAFQPSCREDLLDDSCVC